MKNMKKTTLIVMGIVLLVIAAILFVISGKALEEKQIMIGFLLFAGIFSLLSLFCVFVFGYLYGTGQPRDSSEMKTNQIYEIVGKVPAGMNMVIIVARKQNGKTEIFRFNQKQAPDAKFIKVIKNDKGNRELQPFPPPVVFVPEILEAPEKPEVS